MAGLRFGEFEFDPVARQLRRAGSVVHLARRPFDVLEYLIAERPRLVSRRELLERFWAGRAVYEEALTRCVSSIRKALDDQGDPPRCLETRWAEGYRFIAVVAEAPVEATADAPATAPVPPVPPVSPPLRPAARRGWWAAGAVLAVALVALLVARSRAPDDEAIRRLAVLPPDSPSIEPWLVDGLTDELTDACARIEGLSVIARGSVRRSLEVETDPARIARSLGVDALLSWRLRESGADGRRLALRLVRARDGAVIWTHEGSYSSDELSRSAHELAQRLAVRLSAKLRAPTAPTPRDAQTYETYLRARFHWNQRTASSLRDAIRLYEAATTADPAFADAWAGLAESWLLMPLYAGAAPFDAHPRARRAAEAALARDPANSRAHAVLGVVSSQFEWNWRAADQYFARALELDPNNATAQQWLAEAWCYRREFERCAEHLREALELDPLSPILAVAQGLPARFSGDYVEARRIFAAALAAHPSFPFAEYQLALVDSALGDWQAAARRYEHLQPVLGPVLAGAPLAYVYARSGRRADALALRADLERLSAVQYVPPLAFSDIAIGLGERDEALRWVQRAMVVHDDFLVTLAVDHHHRELRGEPRFEAMLSRLGLPPPASPPAPASAVR